MEAAKSSPPKMIASSRGCGGDLLEVENALGGLHVHQEADGADRPAMLQFGGLDDLAGPLDLSQLFQFGDHDAIGTVGQHGLDILLLQAGADGVDACQFFRAAEVQFLQSLGNREARLGLLVDGDAVFHIHADTVDAEREGFFDLVAVVARHVEQCASGMHELLRPCGARSIERSARWNALETWRSVPARSLLYRLISCPGA